MYIGKVSEITGASVKAIRMYHELGLLQGVTRLGKYRRFSERDVQLVALIKQAQSVGFTLAEMRLAIGDAGPTTSWVRLLALIEQKESEINNAIAALEAKKALLVQHKNSIEQCLAKDPGCNISSQSV